MRGGCRRLGSRGKVDEGRRPAAGPASGVEMTEMRPEHPFHVGSRQPVAAAVPADAMANLSRNQMLVQAGKCVLRRGLSQVPVQSTAYQ